MIVTVRGGGDRFRRVYVQGRSAADALARQWIADIERTGAPVTGVDGHPAPPIA